MELYLEASYGTRQLKIVSKFAFDNKLYITIKFPDDRNPGFVVADETEDRHDEYTYIETDGFNTYEELSEYIATTIIGG